MSQENVAAHQCAMEAFNQRDLGGFLALMDDEIEVIAQATGIEGQFRGHNGMLRWWHGLLGVFPDWNVEVLEVRDLGDTTLAVMRAHGHGAGSEMPLELQIWQTAQWRNGRCVWWRSFRTEPEALEAAGLSE
jgi:SnoaL-like domain